eukprot:CAMPEP_0170602470 /NCGR_PEP_ID=MMETSP0224-20130122/18405_1 /TAXON_ID=285029 /ORGANISM="Togula jolla, Strain CCCM 725" /LENGTH=311 /DNA_ID=CAMNT_0010927305 /DNA_START=66 /DNA_END=1001 /DNA_ORIENTATION=+
MARGPAQRSADPPEAILNSSSVIPEDRSAALQLGVTAVVDAMAGEKQFANDNERAFALLRIGCRHCEGHQAALDAVGPKPLVVAFLVRVAVRRTMARRLQELAAILAQSVAWRSLLLDAPQPLRDVLESTFSPDTALPSLLQLRSADSSPPAHRARIFLREQRSKKYLTVAQSSTTSEHCVILTTLAASLFICHHAARAGMEPDAESDEKQDGKGLEESAPVLGFAHEGIPELGSFLSFKAPWHAASSASAGLALCCNSRQLHAQAQFQWHANARLQHVRTGRWLYVDPSCAEMVTMHTSEASSWQALPAL